MLGGTHLYNYGIIVLLRVEEAKIEQVQELYQLAQPGKTYPQAAWLQGSNLLFFFFWLQKKEKRKKINKKPKMQYFGAISKMTEWSRFISKGNQSVSQ